ncbi:MAG: tRNA (adenosine(37)-N6)-threonylcarbamoyltransferase complex transferase subunit TsaD [Candidatus Dependentiae bacterium]|nr:tRNA (adenosine(37)-N6)-threonylcarbamoyltransferase complex transferase subunit TsaD [Candidatus Dependentiae bacterium]
MALRILGIETSCDETGAAIYEEGKGIIANALFSQIELHQKWGGVVPEIASRSQLEKINPIVNAALEQAQIKITDIDAIAVTNRPGLAGSLLVGVCFAKAVAWAIDKPIIGVNHLEGHAFSACIENEIPFPFLCITASGGHTSLYLVHDFGNYTILGQTVDDAAGEAFDKIAKLMNLPYPGGPVIEKLAAAANFEDYYHYPRNSNPTLDFSFSGLKTAVLYDLVKKNAYDMSSKKFLAVDDLDLQQKVSSSLLVCVASIFKQKLERALKEHPEVKAIAFVGGVACNKYIRNELKELSARHALPFFVPSPQYCTDNGAMIAFVGYYKAKRHEFSNLDMDILK